MESSRVVLVEADEVENSEVKLEIGGVEKGVK